MSSEREKFDDWFRKTRYMMPKYDAMLDAWNARAALAAYEQAGWKLVPVEPTPEMLRAEPPSGFEISWQRRPEVWAAMLAATPPAPAPEATPAQAQQADELLCKALTDEQLGTIWRHHCGGVPGQSTFAAMRAAIDAARGIEAAHNIGNE